MTLSNSDGDVVFEIFCRQKLFLLILPAMQVHMCLSRDRSVYLDVWVCSVTYQIFEKPEVLFHFTGGWRHLFQLSMLLNWIHKWVHRNYMINNNTNYDNNSDNKWSWFDFRNFRVKKSSTLSEFMKLVSSSLVSRFRYSIWGLVTYNASAMEVIVLDRLDLEKCLIMLRYASSCLTRYSASEVR